MAVDDTVYWMFGLSRGFALPDMPLFQKDQELEIGFKNYGQYADANNAGYPVYATDFTVSTGYTIGYATITPALTYTANYREAVNNGDGEIWGGVTVGVGF